MKKRISITPENYYFQNPNTLVLQSNFNLLRSQRFMKATLNVVCSSCPSEITVYLDKSGSITDFSNLDANANAEKIDVINPTTTIAKLNVTKAFYDMSKQGTIPTTQRFIVVSNLLQNILSSTQYLEIEYDEYRAVRERKVLVPFQTENVSGGINLAERTLEFEFADTAGSGRMPISVKHVYNSRLKREYDTVKLDNGDLKYIFYSVGCGFKLNYQQYLIIDSATSGTLSDGNSNVYYTWINAVGDFIEFRKNAISNEITCEQNYNLTLNADGNYEISDVSGNKLTFAQSNDSKKYNLIKISDSCGNYLTLNYNDQKNRLISIVKDDSNKVEIAYDYDTDMMASITETVNGKKVIIYYDVNADFCITAIRFKDENNLSTYKNIYVKYAATENDEYYPYMIYELNGHGYYFSSEEGEYLDVSKLSVNNGIENGIVQEIAETEGVLIGGKRCKLKELYYISYGERMAKVEDVVGESFTTYTFDYFGNCVSSYVEDYNKNTEGNPQSISFVKSRENLDVSLKGNVGWKDFSIGATSTSTQTTLSNFAIADKRLLLRYIEKQGLKSSVNTVVYAGNSTIRPKITLSNDLKAHVIEKNYDSPIIVSAWAKANSLPIIEGLYDRLCNEQKACDYVKFSNVDEVQLAKLKQRRFDLCVDVTFEDDSVKTFRNSFDWTRTDFQYCETPVLLTTEEWSIVSSVKVYVDYAQNEGSVYLYGVSVVGGSYMVTLRNEYKLPYYETNGNLKTYTQFEYNNKNQLYHEKTCFFSTTIPISEQTYVINETTNKITKVTDLKGNIVEYEYSTQGDLVKTTKYNPNFKNESQQPLEIVEEMVYNEKGNVLSTKNSFGENVANYEYVYNTVSKVTPVNLNSVNYSYDTTYSLLTKISSEVGIYENNNTTQYVNGVPIKDSDVANTVTASGNTTIEYNYDHLGRVTAVKINGSPYCTYAYNGDKEQTVTYANGEGFKVVENTGENVLTPSITRSYIVNSNETNVDKINYDSNERLSKYEDFVANETIDYSYNENGKISCVTKVNDSTEETLTKTDYEYDELQRIKKQTLTVKGVELDSVEIIYPPLGEETESSNETIYSHSAFGRDRVETDSIGRVVKTEKNGGVYTKEYEYKTVGRRTSNLVSKESFKRYSPTTQVNLTDKSLDYTYNVFGKVTQVTETESGVTRVIQAFSYDSLGRLVREDNYYFDESYVFVYDNAGNIVDKLTYPFVLNGELDESDLTQAKSSTYSNGRLNSNGILGGAISYCSYDTLRNPTNYLGRVATWSHGHRLDSFNGIGYEYNAKGIRTKKTNGNSVTKFILDGERIVATENTSPSNSTTMKFYYGADGLTAFESGGNKYFYQKNIFGDIIGIYDSNFNWVARYVYDAWGNCKVVDEDGSELIYDSSLIAHQNPFRYRGYYFDVETGLYYLQSRYYDPVIGRFLCPDSIEYLDPTTLGGLNLYAYCNNDPVNYADPSGHFAWLIFLGVVAISTVAAAIDGGITAAMSGQDFWKGFAAGAIGGAIGGAVAELLKPIGPWGSIIGRGISSGVYDVLNELFQTGKVESNNIPLYVADVVMDMTYSLLYVGYFGEFAKPILGSSLSVITDSGVDILETYLFFSPNAQKRIRSGIY